MIVWRWENDSNNWAWEMLLPEKSLRLHEHALLFPLSGNRCALIASDCITVNGEAALPARILNHKDEIAFEGETFHFSLESPVEVVTFARQTKQVSCGRCKGKIEDQEHVVRCPQCGAWHHQSESLECWTHDERCSACDQATQGLSWMPDSPRRTSMKAAL